MDKAQDERDTLQKDQQEEREVLLRPARGSTKARDYALLSCLITLGCRHVSMVQSKLKEGFYVALHLSSPSKKAWTKPVSQQRLPAGGMRARLIERDDANHCAAGQPDHQSELATLV